MEIIPLFLGPTDSPILRFLETSEPRVLHTVDKVDLSSEIVLESNFLISYGYRYILSEEVLAHYQHRAINLHVSMLPWNRGADPNLWSFLEDTPKGVTIHSMDKKLDRGPILLQSELTFDINDTLRTSYQKLTAAVEGLFIQNWKRLKSDSITPQQQDLAAGSFHTTRDRQKYESYLSSGWDTPVSQLTGIALDT